MLFVKFQCPSCGELFKKFGLLVSAGSTSTCPKCGETPVPLLEEDRKRLELEAEKRCSNYG